MNCVQNFSKVFEDIGVLTGGGFLMKTGTGSEEKGQGGFCWLCLRTWTFSTGSKRCGMYKVRELGLACILEKFLCLQSELGFKGGRTFRTLNCQVTSDQGFGSRAMAAEFERWEGHGGKIHGLVFAYGICMCACKVCKRESKYVVVWCMHTHVCKKKHVCAVCVFVVCVCYGGDACEIWDEQCLSGSWRV